jgi:hypothetical protein
LVGVQPVARPLPTHRTTQAQENHTQTSMTRVGFEPVIPVFEQAKTVDALDSAAAVISVGLINVHKFLFLFWRYVKTLSVANRYNVE